MDCCITPTTHHLRLNEALNNLGVNNKLIISNLLRHAPLFEHVKPRTGFEQSILVLLLFFPSAAALYLHFLFLMLLPVQYLNAAILCRSFLHL